MASYRVSYLAALGACIAASAFPGHLRAEPRAVVELFTSQGCSSCPPADKLLGQLVADPNLIAISLPVDYWDSLGWKDTLADPRNSARQRAYAQQRGDRGVYTPQMVVNGGAHVVGSDKAELERALARAPALAAPVRLSITGTNLTVTVAAAQSRSAAGEVWLYALAKAVPVAVGRGENRGRTVTYHNIARHWQKVGEWSGDAASWNVPLSAVRRDDADTAVVLVQGGSADKPGPMLGAAVAAVR